MQIGEPINKGTNFGESLLKCIAEIVGPVGGDNENRSRENNGEDGATCGLAHTAFAFNEDLLETLLLQYVMYHPFW